MRRILTLALFGAFAFATLPAFAADAPAPNPQQERMKTCNAKAGDMKGDERKKFMSDCLSAEKKTYDNRMGACNTASKGKTGDERKAFMSECMKKAA
jgi:hypothetical protein